ATDAQSGVVACTLKVIRTPTSVKVTATAKDRAGNVAPTSLSYRTVPFFLNGAAYKGGSFKVVKGRTYTVVALTGTATRPRLIGPIAAGKRFRGPGKAFTPGGVVHGRHRFTARVKITFKSGTWRLGVQVGKTVHVIKLHH